MISKGFLLETREK